MNVQEDKRYIVQTSIHPCGANESIHRNQDT